MKRIALFVFVLMFVASTAYGWLSPIGILEDYKVLKGGASVFVVDLTKSEYAEAETFNLQLDKATPYYGGTGATIPVFRWAVSNHIPSGIKESDIGKNVTGVTYLTEVLEWTPIIPNTIVHTTGTSRYVWPWEIEYGRYMLVKVDNISGITDFEITADIGLSKKRLQASKAIHLGTRTYLLTATTGTSTFGGNDSYGETIPEGARYALIKSWDGGASVWTTRRTTVDRDKDPALQAGDVFPVEGSFAELKRIGLAAATTARAIVDFYTRKPF